MTITRSKPHTFKRNRNPEINQPESVNPVLITAATAVGTVLTLTFDGVVSLQRDAVPAFTVDVASTHAVSAEQTGPNVVEVTFNAAIAAATAITLKYQDPAIRNASGGYVTSNTFPV